MKRLILIVVLLCFTFYSGEAQLLLTSISVDSLPVDTDMISSIPFALDDPLHENTGPQEGSFVHDFTLYDLDGNAVTLSEELEDGLPILLVSGSYTCYRFRTNLPVIEYLRNTYQGQIKIFIIYCVEAHPINDASPYFGYVNPGSGNIDLGITYEQPDTYGERKAIVNDMLNDGLVDINVPVLIDGPENNWWSVFGPAENNAYLITPQGQVFENHGWFNLFEDMEDSILEFLELPENGAAGLFDVELIDDTIKNGPATEPVIFTMNLNNLGSEPFFVSATKSEENIPDDWYITLCGDACLDPEINSTLEFLEEFEQDQFSIYFFNDSPGLGSVKLELENEDNELNKVAFHFHANTLPTEIAKHQKVVIKIWPNPASDLVSIDAGEQNIDAFELISSSGEVVRSFVDQSQLRIDVSDLPAGLYFYRYFLESGNKGNGKIVVE